eukprot:2898025-Rhodomonas_salina.1
MASKGKARACVSSPSTPTMPFPPRMISMLFTLSLFVSCWAYDPYIQVDGSPLLVVQQVTFNATCTQSPSGTGCWEVELLYKTEGANSALFLPGQPGSSAFASAQEYENTYSASNFPCSIANYDPTAPSSEESACCIEYFLAKYRPVASFRTWAAGKPSGALSYPNGTCNTRNGSTLLNDAAPQDILGDIDSGIAKVLEVPSEIGDPAGSSRAMVIIPDDNLLNITIEASRGRKFFVGMVSFTPAGTRFLDSAVQQVSIEVEKTTYATVTTSATSDHTFINWVNARVHRVSSLTSPNFAYYATVLFAIDMSAGLVPDPTAKLVPDSSVLIGQVDHACNASQLNALSPTFYQILSEEACSPWADANNAESAMCAGDQQSSFNVNDGAGVINIPLGTTAPSDPLDIQFVVAVQDNGKPYYSTISILLTTTDDSFTTWCESGSGISNYATDYVTSSLIVGSAQTSLELSSLQTISPLTATGSPPVASVEATQVAKSLQSGLMTFVLDGSALPDDALTVHIEDMFTLHINGDATASAVAAELAATPFNISEDFQAKTASLELSANLSALCPPNPSSYLETCASRREVDDKSARATTYQLKSGDPAAFMQTLFAGQSAFAAELGTSYEALLESEYSLDARTKAWWITPGFNWTGPGTSGSGVFALSSKVVLVALVKLEDGRTGSWRRSLLVTTRTTTSDPASPDAGTVSETSVQYPVDAVSLTAAVHGVSADLVTAWTFGLAVEEAQACLPEQELRAWARATLLSLLQPASSGVQNVQVAALRLNAAGVRCGDGASWAVRGAQAAESQGSDSPRRALSRPFIEVDVVLVSTRSEGGAAAYIDANKLMSDTRVTSLQQTTPSASVRLGSGSGGDASAPDSPDSGSEEAVREAAVGEGEDESGVSRVWVPATLSGAAACLALLSCFLFLLWWRARAAPTPALPEHLPPSEYAEPVKMWVEAELVGGWGRGASGSVSGCGGRSSRVPSDASRATTRLGSLPSVCELGSGASRGLQEGAGQAPDDARTPVPSSLDGSPV